MLDITEKSKKFTKSLWNFTKGFTLLLTYEVIEELLEESIAWAITTIAARAISFLVVVLLTQSTKVTIKGLAKGLTVLLKPLVKKITYRAGNDKIDKIRRIYKTMKNAVAKFIAFVARNKKSILATTTAFLASIGVGGAVDTGMIFAGVELPKYAFYLVALGVAIFMFVPTFIGIKGAGIETQQEYDDRLKKEEEAKAEKKALKEAEAKAKAEQEEILALAKAEEQKKLEEEQAKKEEQAKLQAEQEERRKQDELNRLKQEYALAVANGFEGSLIDFIKSK